MKQRPCRPKRRLPQVFGTAVLCSAATVRCLGTTSVDDAPATIHYALPSDGLVSLHIRDASGCVVRELLHAAPRAKGRQAERWDGLDERGQPVPPGAYTWKLLQTQGLRAEYLLSVGINPRPPWEGWPGAHRAIASLACDRDGLYVFTDCGEGAGMGVKLAWADEKRQWTIPHWYEVWCGMVSAGLLDGQVYMLQRNQRIYRADAQKGERNAGPWEVSVSNDVQIAAYNDTHQVTDLAAGQGQVVLSYARHDLLRWIDPRNGNVIDEVSVPEPYGVGIGGDGRVYVLSRDRVLSLSRTDKAPREVVPAGRIDSGFRLDVDPAGGDILVAENRPVRAEARAMYWKDTYVPARSDAGQQVKRFARDGRLLAAYGRPAGRRYGRYDAADFDNVVDIAVTPRGGFAICESESPPRRTAVFDAAGKLAREWYGAQMYGNWCQPDPDDPTSVWFASSWNGVVHAKVDYARRTWAVHATYGFGEFATWFGLRTAEFRPLHRDGQTYLAAVGGPVVYRVDEAARRLVPLVYADPNIGNRFREMPAAATAHGTIAGILGNRREQSMIWTRPDGGIDRVRAEDLRFSNWWNWTYGWTVDRDFAYVFESKHTDEVRNIFRLAPAAWSKDGTPIYDFEKRQPIAADVGRSPTNHPRNPNHYCETLLMPDGQGNLFSAYNTDMVTRRFGQGFWGNRAGCNTVAKWDADGRLLWTVGRHAAGRECPPGEAKHFWRITGTPHGCVVVNDTDNGLQHVWDEDGLWVGRLLDNPVEGPAPASAYRFHGGENFGSSVFTVTKEMPVAGLNRGDVVFFLGFNCNPVYRITGWDLFRRQSGRIELTRTAAARVVAAEQAETPVRIPYLDNVTVDGDLAEWGKIEPLIVRDGAKTQACVRVAWNPSGLYAAFDVRTDAPWKSAATPQTAFQGGAEVDVCVGPVGDRTAPGPGDVRYVAAPLASGDGLVEFLPVLAPGMDAKEEKPATYETFNGKVTFARVATRPDQRVASKTRAGGYIVEMVLPMRAPLELRPGQRLRIEAACTVADASGTKAVARFPWHSRSGEDQMVLDSFVEAQLRPAHWGRAILGD